MSNIVITKDYAWIIAAVASFYLQQALLAVPVAMARSKFKIAAPSFYPRDSEIKERNMSAEDVDEYMRAQRAHQNNQEFLTIYLPLLLVAGLVDPIRASQAAALIWIGRLLSSVGYIKSAKMRAIGGWFHIPELYTVYLVFSGAYSILNQ